MSKLIKKELILVKLETTRGTDSVPTATDVLHVEDLNFSRTDELTYTAPNIDSFFGTRAARQVGANFEITFNLHLRGTGTAGDVPECGPLFRACGMTQTIDAGVDVRYAPASLSESSQETVSIYIFEDGNRYRFVGGAGTWSASAEAGGAIVVSFSIKAERLDESEVANPAVSNTNIVPPLMCGVSTVTSAGTALSITSFNLDIANTVSTPLDVAQSNCYGLPVITDREPTGSIDPLQTAINTKNFLADLENGTTQSIDIGPIGSAGNQITFDIPFATFTGYGRAERDNLRSLDMAFAANKSVGDDEFTIIFS